MKRVFLFLLSLALAANAFAGITVVKATKVNTGSSYIELYKATYFTSQTLTTKDTIVVVGPTGSLFDLSSMADSLISIRAFIKTGQDSSHIKIEMAATWLPTARTATAYAGYEWLTTYTKSDSDAASYYHDIVLNKNTAGNTQFVPYLARFSVAEILLLNEYVTAANPATIWISWRKQKPVAR